MQFEKGHPGGPGRPPGSRNKINQLLDQLAAGRIEELMTKALDAAGDGNDRTRDMILRRMWSPPKSRPVEIALPAINQPQDLIPAHAAVVAAMAAQEISPAEASEVTSVLEAQRRAFELCEQQQRLEKLVDNYRRLKAKLSS